MLKQQNLRNLALASVCLWGWHAAYALQPISTVITLTGPGFKTSDEGNITLTATGSIKNGVGSTSPAIKVDSNKNVTLNTGSSIVLGEINAISIDSGKSTTITVELGGKIITGNLDTLGNAIYNNAGNVTLQNAGIISAHKGIPFLSWHDTNDGTYVLNNSISGVIGFGLDGTSNTGAAIALQNGTVESSITNDGKINGSIFLNNAKGTLTNTGTITSTGMAIAVADKMGAINNQGIIKGGSTALDLSGSTNSTKFTNSGTVTGQVLLSKAATAGDEVFKMDGGSITAALPASPASQAVIPALGDAAATYNLNGGELPGGFSLGFSSQPDIINFKACVTNITGNPTKGQTLNVLGSSTTGSITNIDNINIGKGIVFTVNHKITGASTLLKNEGVLIVSPPSGPNAPEVSIANLDSDAGTLIFQASTTEYSKITLTSGTASLLNGSTVLLLLTGTHALGEEFTLVEAPDGSPQTTLTSKNLLNIGQDFSLEQIPVPNKASIKVKLIARPPSSLSILFRGEAGMTSGMKHAAITLAKINTLPDTSAEFNTFFTALLLLPAEEKNAILSALLPMSNYGEIQVAQSIQGGVFDGLLAYLHNYDPILYPYSAGDGAPRRGAWAKVMGSIDTKKAYGNYDGYDLNGGGIMAGYDRACGKGLIGVAVSYSKAAVRSKSAFLSKEDVDSIQLMGYASSGYKKPGYVNAIVGIAHQYYNISRQTGQPSALIDTTAAYQGWHYGVNIESGYRFIGKKCSITPILIMKHSFLQPDAYTETGSSVIRLKVQNESVQTAVTGLGLKLDSRYGCRGRRYIPECRVKVFYDWLATGSRMNVSFLEAPLLAFTNEGAQPDHMTYNVGASLNIIAKEKLRFTLNYDLDLKKNYVRHAPSVSFVYEF